jgi:putative PEP-CTERM system TPR-repeat lipoprotein
MSRTRCGSHEGNDSMPTLASTFRIAMAVTLAALVVACSGGDPAKLLASAKDYLAKHDTKSAEIQLKNALEKEPDLAEARYLLGRTLLERGDVAAAEKELRRARDLKYPAGEVDPPLAMAWARLGQYQQVIDKMSTAQGATPTLSAELKTAIAQAQLGLGKADLAKASFAEAQASDPRYAPALIGEAVIAARRGDVAGATAAADKALAIAPGDADVLQLKGDLMLAQGRDAEAATMFRKAIAADGTRLTSYWALISTLIRDGKPADARAVMTSLKAVAPKHPQTYYYDALLLSQERKFGEARDAIQLYLAAVPESVPGLMLAATVDYELRDYERAEAGAQKALARSPANDFARRVLIATYLRTGQPGKAMDALQPMLPRIANNAALQGVAGEVYLQNGDPATAAGYFERAAALNPKGVSPKAGLALTRLALGDPAGGMKELESAAAMDTGTHADLMLVAVALRQQHWDEALTALDALEKKDPGKPVTANLRGLALLGKRDNAGARTSFEHALSLDPNYFPAVSSLVRLDVAEKKVDAAKKRLEDYLAKHPGDGTALIAQAELLASTGASNDDVVAVLNKAVAANPKLVQARVALIRNFLRIHKPKDAVLAAQDASNAIPQNAEILDALGQSQQAAGDTGQALSTYARLAEQHPDSPLPWMRTAMLQAATRNDAAASQSFRRALAIKPDLLDAQKGLIGVELRQDHAKEALTIAKDVQQQRPKDSIGYIMEGEIHAARREWPKAIAAYETGVKQSGTTDAAVKLYGAHVASGQSAEAAKMASTWLGAHPQDDTFRFALAEIAGARKDYVSAARYYREILERQSQNPLVLNNLAWVAGQLHDPKALEYAEKANQLAPNRAPIMDTLGTLLVAKGDTARGVELLRKAVDLDPGRAEIRLNFARALIRAGQTADAKKELDTLAGLGDKFAQQEEVARLRRGL